MPPPIPYVPNVPLPVAINLQYVDSNGVTVNQLYPNQYIQIIGSKVSQQVDQYNIVNSTLVSYDTRISDNTAAIEILQLSGDTMPMVNGSCLNGGQNDYVQNITNLLVNNSCSYNSILGTTTGLGLAVAAQCVNLATEPAYSQNTDMAALAGWVTTPTTIADSFNNLWLAYCDARVGITQALAQSTINCSSIIITISGYYNPTTKVLRVYTGGSYIPSNFSDAGTSSLRVIDSFNNVTASSFDVESVLAAGYVDINLTGTGLSQTSDYNVFFIYGVTSTTPSLGCSGTKVITVGNTTVVCTPMSFVETSNSIQYSFTPYITENVVYSVTLMTSSGDTVDTSALYINPTTTVTGTFTNLDSSTTYQVQMVVQVSGVDNICSLYTVQTTA